MSIFFESKSEVKRSPEELKRNLAQTSTRYSQVPVEIRANTSSALDCIVVLIIASYFQPWATEVLVRSIGQQAYFHNYEGEWSNVQKVLEYETTSPDKVEEILISIYGPRTYYGNLLPRTEKFLRAIKFKDTTKPDHRPVRRTQRHRGYRDKGSCRLPHEYHGDPPEKEEREDRRLKISHPLINYNEQIKEFAGIGKQPSATAPERSEKDGYQERLTTSTTEASVQEGTSGSVNLQKRETRLRDSKTEEKPYR